MLAAVGAAIVGLDLEVVVLAAEQMITMRLLLEAERQIKAMQVELLKQGSPHIGVAVAAVLVPLEPLALEILERAA